MAINEVPNLVFGRNLHEQQTQFYRSDIFGGVKANEGIDIGRVSRGTVMLRGLILVDEPFSAGTIDVFYGERKLVSAFSLTAKAGQDIVIDNNYKWNIPDTLAEYKAGKSREFQLYAVVSADTSDSVGMATVIFEGIEPRVSNIEYGFGTDNYK